ncbi:MAG: hypothetical protein U1F56_13895 [Rubrivivax sp.]
MTAVPLTRRACLATALAAGAGMAQAQPAGEPGALARVKARGRLTVAVYNDMPPFHVAGKGIDVELAAALAKALGVEAVAAALPMPTRT